MSPRKGSDLSGNGGRRELQSLLESAIVQKTDIKDDAAFQIPWRTSTRLQEAALRSLVEEREIDEAEPRKKEKSSPEASSVRLLKRHRSPSSPTTPLQPCQTEETEDEEGNGDSSVNEDNSRKGIIVCGESGSRRRKKRTVHFANPLVYYIKDKTPDERICKPVAERRSVQKTGKFRGLPKSGVGTLHPPKIPMSCFDLLCNYSGSKGWRCYRACIEGESYCNIHLPSRKTASPPVVRISVCT